MIPLSLSLTAGVPLRHALAISGGILAFTAYLYVWAWCVAASEADARAERCCDAFDAADLPIYKSSADRPAPALGMGEE